MLDLAALLRVLYRDESADLRLHHDDSLEILLEKRLLSPLPRLKPVAHEVFYDEHPLLERRSLARQHHTLLPAAHSALDAHERAHSVLFSVFLQCSPHPAALDVAACNRLARSASGVSICTFVLGKQVN